MSDCVEGGATIAWRLLATLEGGSLVVTACALLAYTARGRSAASRGPPPCATVALTNATCKLGKEIKSRLEAHGCVVTVTSGATSGADKYDGLVVVGAEPTGEGLDGLSDLVMDDVYSNIKLLETLSSQVNPGGYIIWASAGKRSLGVFDKSAEAFDTVLHASLLHIAKVFQCCPLWVGRSRDTQHAAERVVAALVTTDTPHTGYSIRNAVRVYCVSVKVASDSVVGGYFYRWLKTIT